MNTPLDIKFWWQHLKTGCFWVSMLLSGLCKIKERGSCWKNSRWRFLVCVTASSAWCDEWNEQRWEWYWFYYWLFFLKYKHVRNTELSSVSVSKTSERWGSSSRASVQGVFIWVWQILHMNIKVFISLSGEQLEASLSLKTKGGRSQVIHSFVQLHNNNQICSTNAAQLWK